MSDQRPDGTVDMLVGVSMDTDATVDQRLLANALISHKYLGTSHLLGRYRRDSEQPEILFLTPCQMGPPNKFSQNNSDISCMHECIDPII